MDLRIVRDGNGEYFIQIDKRFYGGWTKVTKAQLGPHTSPLLDEESAHAALNYISNQSKLVPVFAHKNIQPSWAEDFIENEF